METNNNNNNTNKKTIQINPDLFKISLLLPAKIVQVIKYILKTHMKNQRKCRHLNEIY